MMLTRPPHSTPRLRATVTAFLFILLPCAAAPAYPKRPEAAVRVETKLSADLLALVDDAAASKLDRVRVIVQRADRRAARADVVSDDDPTAVDLPLIGGFAAELPIAEILRLGALPTVARISLDREVSGSAYDENHLRVTTGGSQVIGAAGATPMSGQFSGYLAALPAGMPSGAGVGVAVLDSGIRDYAKQNEDLRNLNDPKTKRVVARVDLCSIDPAPASGDGYDPYGHGTHVAATAAGNGRESISDKIKAGNEFSGMAFGANLVDVRVISRDGTGLASDVIRGLDWMVANRAAYNIRVANLSVGTPVRESFRTDPLCVALQRAIDSGITCVVAAGNYGKSASGDVVYGGILSPGNLPAAVTVGAAKTLGTNLRSDDTVASFSSRGPTLVDGATKPDLVAPGDHVIALASAENALTTLYPSLVAYANKKGDIYMQMSGTSVAAPVVAGTAALMLQANPNLTPAMVKAILRFTAQPLGVSPDPWVDYLAEGAGLLNADGAVRVTRALVANPAAAANGADIVQDASSLRAALRPDLSYGTTVAGETFSWGTSVLYSDGLLFVRTSTGDLQILSVEGLVVPDRYIMTNGFVLANGNVLANRYIMTNGYVLANRYIMTNGWMMSNSTGVLPDGFMMSNAAVLTDVFSSARSWSSAVLDQSKLQADPTSSMTLDALGDGAPGTSVFTLGSQSPLFPRRGRSAY